MSIDIQKVPVPENNKPGYVDILRNIEPGSEDSFLVDGSKRSNIQSLARNYKMQVKTRKEGDKIRVWRVQ